MEETPNKDLKYNNRFIVIPQVESEKDRLHAYLTHTFMWGVCGIERMFWIDPRGRKFFGLQEEK